MTIPRLLMALAAVIGPWLAPSVARSAMVWSVSAGDELFREIDPQTGIQNIAGQVGLPGESVIGCRGLAHAPNSQFLYTLVDVGRADSLRLVQIDLTSGAAIRKGTLSSRFRGLAFDCGGTLYGVTENRDGSGEALYRDLVPAAANGTAPPLVMNLGAGDVGEAIAARSFGVLYHYSGGVDAAFERLTIAPPTITPIPVGLVPGRVSALTYWNDQGLFLGAADDRLIRLTPSGSVTMGPWLDHFSSGLAFADQSCGTATDATAAPRAVPSLTAVTPFRGSTLVRFDTPQPGAASLRVFDVTGRAVRDLVGGGSLEAGPHERDWDGRDDTGVRVRAGVYWIRLAIGGDVVSRLVVKLD